MCQMTTASLRAPTRTAQYHRAPLPKVSSFVYEVQPTTASPKAPPKAFPFGERRPGRRNPTKTTPSLTSSGQGEHSPTTACGPRPCTKATKFGRQ